MIRFLAFFCLAATPVANLAAEFKVGDRIFWKEGARGSDGVQEIGIERFAFPSTVRAIQNDFLFLGAGWINKNDALTTGEALEYFNERIAERPNDPTYWVNRGRVWEEMKCFDQAIADYQQAARLSPNNSAIHNNIGTALQKKGDHRAAIKHYDSALQADSSDPVTYYNRGRAYQYTAKFAAAAHDYGEAIRIDPKFLPGINNAAWLAATCPEENCRNGKRALELAQQAAAMTNGTVWEVLDTLAAAQAENGDFPGAIATSEQALQLGADAAIHAGVRDRMQLYQDGKPYRMPIDSPASP